jgi:hypothetical protein
MLRFGIITALLLCTSCADARPRGAPEGMPQIAYNIVSDGGAACNGDVQTGSLTVTSTLNNSTFTISGATFGAGDINKTITITGAGSNSGKYTGKITGVSGSGPYTISTDTNAGTSLAGVSQTVYWGTNDATAFDTFNNWARANQGSIYQVVLTIPNGSNCWFGKSGFNYVRIFNAFAAGINNLIVEGTGATLNSVGGTGFWLGGRGVCQVGLTFADGCSARIQTVSAGSSTVTLTAASLAAGYISRFNSIAGQWIMIGGLNTQAQLFSPEGYPQNFNYFEWRQITNVNAGTGVITLDRPLSNSYSADWPEFNSGSAGEADQAGPASIFYVGNEAPSTGYTAKNTWNTTVEYRGLTISQEGQTYAPGRNVTYRNVTFTGGYGAIPTQNESWSAINSTFASVNMETDKLVGTMLLDGVTIAQIVNQSTSTDRLIIRNSTFTTRLDGGAKYTEITDSTLNNFGPGTWAYGATGTANETICTRCDITTLNYTFGYNSSSDTWWTKSGGVITVPFGAAIGGGPANRYFVPGARVQYRTGVTNPPQVPAFSCCESAGTFEVGTITSDIWPGVDGQSVSMNVTSTNGSKTITVSGTSFSSGDIGKTIIVPGARSGNGDLRTFITGVSGSGPQDLTVYTAASRSQTDVAQTVQWGTVNMYVQTNQSGAFPDYSLMNTFGTAPGLGVVSSFNFTCDSCTGDVNAVGSSIQAGATPGAPLGSFISKTYAPTSAVGAMSQLPGRGTFKSLRVNVTAAAVSGAAVTFNPSTNNWFMLDLTTPSAPVAYNWTPANLAINLKQTGIRMITPSGVTCDTGGGPVAGGCSGDTINLPPNLAGMWIMNGQMAPGTFSAFSGSPSVNIQLMTDPLM